MTSKTGGTTPPETQVVHNHASEVEGCINGCIGMIISGIVIAVILVVLMGLTGSSLQSNGPCVELNVPRDGWIIHINTCPPPDLDR